MGKIQLFLRVKWNLLQRRRDVDVKELQFIERIFATPSPVVQKLAKLCTHAHTHTHTHLQKNIHIIS